MVATDHAYFPNLLCPDCSPSRTAMSTVTTEIESHVWKTSSKLLQLRRRVWRKSSQKQEHLAACLYYQGTAM